MLFFSDDIRKYPKKDRLLITSSKQAIETSLILLSLDRYPHAVLIISEALEKILNVGIRTPKPKGDKRGDYEFRIGEFSKLEKASKKKDDIQNLRIFRNKVAHEGISPEFDEKALSLYCRTGIYSLEVAFEEFFKINLLHDTDNTYGIIYYEIADFLRHTKKVSAKSKCLEDHYNAHYPLKAKIRYLLKPNFVSPFEAEILEKSENMGMSFSMWRKEIRHDYFDDYINSIMCPICSSVMDVKVSDEVVDEEKNIILSRAICRECFFQVDRNTFDMHSDLFYDDLLEIREEVLRGYGIES
jgi:hypothetical protein